MLLARASLPHGSGARGGEAAATRVGPLARLRNTKIAVWRLLLDPMETGRRVHTPNEPREVQGWVNSTRQVSTEDDVRLRHQTHQRMHVVLGGSTCGKAERNFNNSRLAHD